jgi:N-acyl amino acid synthase of PEP-CTERM/exosortase system
MIEFSAERARPGPTAAHFTFGCIDDGPHLAASYALRYRVFCEELGFLAPEACPDGLERDPYDDHAWHVGAFNRAGDVVGTARLVWPSALGLPMFDHCRVEPAAPAALESQVAAEVSRLAVDLRYRRRRGAGRYGLDTGGGVAEPGDGLERRGARPEIVLGLYKEMYQLSKRHGVTHWYAAMERGLLRSLAGFGVRFVPVGPEADYHGRVIPGVVAIEDMEANVFARSPALGRAFVSGLETRFQPRQAAHAGR